MSQFASIGTAVNSKYLHVGRLNSDDTGPMFLLVVLRLGGVPLDGGVHGGRVRLVLELVLDRQPARDAHDRRRGSLATRIRLIPTWSFYVENISICIKFEFYVMGTDC